MRKIQDKPALPERRARYLRRFPAIIFAVLWVSAGAWAGERGARGALAPVLETQIAAEKKAGSSKPQKPSRYTLGDAMFFYERQLYWGAVELLTAIVASEPGNAPGHFALVETYRRICRLEDSLKHYRVASRLAAQTRIGRKAAVLTLGLEKKLEVQPKQAPDRNKAGHKRKLARLDQQIKTLRDRLKLMRKGGDDARTQPDSADDASGTAQNQNILRRLVGIYESRFRESGKFTHIVHVNGFSYEANGRCRFYTEFINETNASAGSTQNLTGRCELVRTKLIQAIAFYPQHRNGTVWTWGVRPNGSNTNGAIDEAIAKGTLLLFDFEMPDDNSFVVSRSGQFVRNNMRRKGRGAAVARPRTAPRGLFFGATESSDTDDDGENSD